MIKNPYKGKFIVFEGIDGCGKSTQYRLLCNYFKRKKIKFIATKEPTDGPIGKLIRKALSGQLKIDNVGLQLLFTADIAYHLKNIVIPNLKKGYVVLSDRYVFSTIAYGGLKEEMDWFIKINDKFLLPDINFVFKIKPEISIHRLKNRSKQEIFEKIKILKKVEKNYEKLIKLFPNNYLINGKQTVENVFKEVKKYLKI